MYGPVLRGALFVLRPPREDDAGPLITWLADPEVTDGLLHRWPPSLDDEREWLRAAAASLDAIHWVIEHEGRIVGTTGITGIDWTNLHATTGTLIGDKTAWRKGIATEMMRRRADFAFTELPLRKLKSGYLEGNEASRRAQASAGYREVGRLRREHLRGGRWVDQVLTELHREDWERARRR